MKESVKLVLFMKYIAILDIYKKYFLLLCSSGVLLMSTSLQSAEVTKREKQVETPEVIVWKTIIAPYQPLKMHRHDHKRIVIALTDTELLVTNDKGKSHKMTWKKGTAHVLLPDRQGEFHVDINKSNHPMEVMVVEFKK